MVKSEIQTTPIDKITLIWLIKISSPYLMKKKKENCHKNLVENNVQYNEVVKH